MADETKNNTIDFGITFEEFRQRIEDKNTLKNKGDLYVGTGETTTYTRPNGEEAQIYKTAVLSAPTEDNQVLMSDSSSDNGIKYGNIIDAVNNVSTTDKKVQNAVNAEMAANVEITNNFSSDNVIDFSIGKFNYRKTIPTPSRTTWCNYSGGIRVSENGNVVVTANSTALTPFDGSISLGTSNSPFKDIWASGEISSDTFNATSDKRLKENIKPFKIEKSILDLPIYEFNFKSDKDKKIHVGCLAQDLQEICPEIVREDDQGYLSIEEGKITYLLIDEVRKLKEEIERLEE